MRLLFLSLVDFNSFNERNIYTDLLREFIKRGHSVYAISPAERHTEVKTHLEEDGRLLKLRIGNVQKTNVLEKGISTLMIEPQYKLGIKKYFRDIKFDLVLYPTPPITFANVLKYIKKRDGAKSYLMLKDIFPQNAVDIGMMSKTGIKGLLYKFFRRKEKKLLSLSDRIGCMSQANVDYILNHNREIIPDKVEICPNCIEVQDVRLTDTERIELRKKYGIPTDKKVFVYGGNLGKPQDVPYIINCLKACADIEGIYFVIAGGGTDRHLLEDYVESKKPCHVKLFGLLPKGEYDRMIACCDIGLIFLDHRFTIPNFPSRLLSYMQAGLPVLACTDSNTDIGRVIVEGGFGWWCESNSSEAFCDKVSEISDSDTVLMSDRAFYYLKDQYSTDVTYGTITGSVDNK